MKQKLEQIGTSKYSKEYSELCEQVKRVQDNHYKVKSQSGNGTYDVMGEQGNWFCTCKGYKHSKNRCKHIKMVDTVVEVGTKTKEIILKALNPDKKCCCPGCSTTEVVKNGVRPNKNYRNQLYYCKLCNKTFGGNVGFSGLGGSPENITDALQLYFTGSSIHEIQQFFMQHGVRFGYTTIYDWIVRYVKKNRCVSFKIYSTSW